jgi:hypothetical protein
VVPCAAPEPASEGLRGAAERSWPEVGMPGDGDPLAEPAAPELLMVVE